MRVRKEYEIDGDRYKICKLGENEFIPGYHRWELQFYYDGVNSIRDAYVDLPIGSSIEYAEKRLLGKIK